MFYAVRKLYNWKSIGHLVGIKEEKQLIFYFNSSHIVNPLMCFVFSVVKASYRSFKIKQERVTEIIKRFA